MEAGSAIQQHDKAQRRKGGGEAAAHRGFGDAALSGKVCARPTFQPVVPQQGRRRGISCGEQFQRLMHDFMRGAGFDRQVSRFLQGTVLQGGTRRPACSLRCSSRSVCCITMNMRPQKRSGCSSIFGAVGLQSRTTAMCSRSAGCKDAGEVCPASRSAAWRSRDG
jgi:hypothetical protein